MPAKKIVVARELAGIRVVTNQGVDLGNLVDLIIDDKTGKILSIIVSLKSTKLMNKYGVEEIEVPYDAVLSICDFIIVDETMIRINK
jgi:sporulation protein YlmC with PRC-barrel domain